MSQQREGGDVQTAPVMGADILGALCQGIQSSKCLDYLQIKRLALIRRHKTSLDTLEKLEIYTTLQSSDQLADRRLGQM